MKAVYNGTVIAESDHTVVVEGNHYFPPDSIKRAHFTPTELTTPCPGKGTASNYSLTVGGETAADAAWYYPEPKDGAAEIRDHVAFYPVVQVTA